MKLTYIPAILLMTVTAYAGENKAALTSVQSMSGGIQQEVLYSGGKAEAESISKVVKMYKAVPGNLYSFRPEMVVAAALTDKDIRDIVPLAEKARYNTEYNPYYALPILASTNSSFDSLKKLVRSMTWAPQDIRTPMALAMTQLGLPSDLREPFRHARVSSDREKALFALLAAKGADIDYLNYTYRHLKNTTNPAHTLLIMHLTSSSPDEMNRLNRDLNGHDAGFDRSQMLYVCAKTGKTPRELQELRRKLYGLQEPAEGRIVLMAALTGESIASVKDKRRSLMGKVPSQDFETMLFSSMMIDASEDVRKDIVEYLVLAQLIN